MCIAISEALAAAVHFFAAHETFRQVLHTARGSVRVTGALFRSRGVRVHHVLAIVFSLLLLNVTTALFLDSFASLTNQVAGRRILFAFLAVVID